MEWRNPVREKLERLDMIDRRTQIEIPEFYVGSILAVTSSDPHAAGKVSRFVGKFFKFIKNVKNLSFIVFLRYLHFT